MHLTIILFKKKRKTWSLFVEKNNKEHFKNKHVEKSKVTSFRECDRHVVQIHGKTGNRKRRSDCPTAEAATSLLQKNSPAGTQNSPAAAGAGFLLTRRFYIFYRSRRRRGGGCTAGGGSLFPFVTSHWRPRQVLLFLASAWFACVPLIRSLVFHFLWSFAVFGSCFRSTLMVFWPRV